MKVLMESAAGNFTLRIFGNQTQADTQLPPEKQMKHERLQPSGERQSSRTSTGKSCSLQVSVVNAQNPPVTEVHEQSASMTDRENRIGIQFSRGQCESKVFWRLFLIK